MTMSLRDQQAALLAALVANGPVPPGWNAERVHAMARSLMQKRARGIGRSWPTLKALLGDDFDARCAAYARVQPLPQHGGPLADGRLLARWLERQGLPLSDAVRRQALAVDQRFFTHHPAWPARRWPSLRLCWLPQAQSWLLALHVPGWLDHQVQVRWPHGWPHPHIR